MKTRSMAPHILAGVNASCSHCHACFAGSRPWRDYESEGQATIVETWYQIFRDNLDSEAARSHVLFPYIANHIRMGNP